MSASEQLLAFRALQYADSRRILVDFKAPLGAGTDGTVWATSRDTALKVLYSPKNYRDERNCYLRLRNAGIEKLGKLTVPLLNDYDDVWQAVEIGVVQPPYILDFGKVYLDVPPPYWGDAQLMANFHAEGRELFEKNWPAVQSVLATLRRLGIYYIDPKPGNINFGED